MGFRRFFYGLWRSSFIKNLVLLTKPFFFFSQKLAENQVLIARPAVFRDSVDVGCICIYIYINKCTYH
jgi:hypothetical protein